MKPRSVPCETHFRGLDPPPSATADFVSTPRPLRLPANRVPNLFRAIPVSFQGTGPSAASRGHSGYLQTACQIGSGLLGRSSPHLWGRCGARPGRTRTSAPRAVTQAKQARRVSWQFCPRCAAEPATEVTVCTYETHRRGLGPSEPAQAGFVRTDRHFSGGLCGAAWAELPTHSARLRSPGERPGPGPAWGGGGHIG